MMSDDEALAEVRSLVVETAEQLRELAEARGRQGAGLTAAELPEAAWSGAVDARARSADDNQRLVAVLREMLEELVALRAASVLSRRRV